MDKLYNFINDNLTTGNKLLSIKEEINRFFTTDVINYCIKNENFTLNKYNRVKFYDFSNELFEIILICWAENSETRIHDHPENGCLLHLLYGNLEEYLYDFDTTIKKITTLNQFDTSYLDNQIGYHKIKSITNTMSLHIYSPPNHKMKIYSEI